MRAKTARAARRGDIGHTRACARTEIGNALNLSHGTVRNYRSDAVNKVGATNRIEAARIAREKGWL